VAGHPTSRARTGGAALLTPPPGPCAPAWPHRDDEQHRGATRLCRATGTGRSTRVVSWTGGTERAMVVDGYTWTRVPGTTIEVRALTDKPLALRYRSSGHRSRGGK
jgi:hypothetical protein